MLRPAALTTDQLVVAVKPSAGYESRLFICPTNGIEIGVLELAGANSGVWTESPEAAAWTGSKNVLAVIENGYNGSANISLAWGGASCTFAAASHHTMSANMFPAGYARELNNVADTAYTRPGGGPTPTNNVDAKGVKIRIFALPDVTAANFILAGCKVSLDHSSPAPESAPVQCGRNVAAYVKEGQIPDKTFNLVGKIPVEGDALTRIAGIRVLLLKKIIKEDKVEVSREFFIGAILQPTRRNQESMESDTLNFTGRFEATGMVIANGPA